MTQARLLADLTDDVVMAAFAASVLFIVVYTVLAPFWRSAIGRALVMMDAGVTLTLAPAVLYRLLGLRLVVSIGFRYYYLASLTLVAAATFWRAWIVAREQWKARNDPGPRSEPAEKALR